MKNRNDKKPKHASPDIEHKGLESGKGKVHQGEHHKPEHAKKHEGEHHKGKEEASKSKWK